MRGSYTFPPPPTVTVPQPPRTPPRQVRGVVTSVSPLRAFLEGAEITFRTTTSTAGVTVGTSGLFQLIGGVWLLVQR